MPEPKRSVMPEPTRILCTRPLDASLCEWAAVKGIVLETLSFIETSPVPGDELGEQIKALSLRPLIAVFTSANGVEAVAERLHLSSSRHAGPGASLENTRPATIPRAAPATIPWAIYCIGGATRQAVSNFFGAGCIAGTADSAKALAELIICDAASRTDLREVFFFCGDLRRDELPSALRRAAIGVTELIVYTARQVRHEVGQAYDGIVFFSPSAVHSFFFANGVAAGTLLFAIGQTTAGAIREYCANRTIISQSPEKETLIQMIIDFYKQEHN
jgi:uroporphyrinogen-III synthase